MTHQSQIEVESQRNNAAVAHQDGRDPSLPANHPINALNKWRKFFILLTLSYSGFLANFSVAIIQVAFPTMGKAFGVSPGQIPKTIGYNLLGIAVGPLFWNPLSRTIGRRPVYLLGSLLFIPCVVWMALSKTYVEFAIARVFAGITSSFSQTIPPATVGDIYVKEVRGSKMSMFAVAVVIAPAIAPVFCGLIIEHTTWRALFWLILGLAVLQFGAFFFVVPETLWNQDDEAPMHNLGATANPESQAASGDYDGKDCDVKAVTEHVEQAPNNNVFAPGHVGAAWMPWKRPGEYLRITLSPILIARYLTIVIPSIYYGSIFAWSVGITIVMPQKFEEPPYDFALIPLGAAFLAFGIGGVLGKWSGGIVGDKVISYMVKKKGYREPEHRLWALLPILPFMFVGCLIVGLVVHFELHWIAYLIGGGLFFFCLSAATGVLQTYVLEGYLSRSMDTQAVFVFFKSIWGFAIAFFVYDWGEEHGFLSEYIVQGALAAGVGAIICIVFILKGRSIRDWQGMPTASH
ncbi:uncharacterized protein I303_104106 [Kwoniella dejecticola CBS 10117]|uniref:Major facilitator superfamily (MFS) profile domain-containing protein n=1 Tax=Kwoniella dejecticola CBS 10117 TaxID=1296121 RepID=A0A1A6A8L7_9TREE|nr:uncharacterized protein I303_04125 [Kwoniella dejecticola CBS 10117]OBR86401.1 hypothetical protein I303_04125 [Kwoniella dejecticola CBS 10117]